MTNYLELLLDLVEDGKEESAGELERPAGPTFAGSRRKPSGNGDGREGGESPGPEEESGTSAPGENAKRTGEAAAQDTPLRAAEQKAPTAGAPAGAAGRSGPDRPGENTGSAGGDETREDREVQVPEGTERESAAALRQGTGEMPRPAGLPEAAGLGTAASQGIWAGTAVRTAQFPEMAELKSAAPPGIWAGTAVRTAQFPEMAGLGAAASPEIQTGETARPMQFSETESAGPLRRLAGETARAAAFRGTVRSGWSGEEKLRPYAPARTEESGEVQARRLDRVFERDARRYDGEFTLY